MYNLSASSLYRAIECPASAVLKQTRQKPYYVQKAANRGTACHKYLEEIALGVNPDTALERVPGEYRDWCSKVDRSLVPTHQIDCIAHGEEVALVYNALAREARYVGIGVGRAYGDLVHGDIPGTIDLAWLQEMEKTSPLLHVVDYKSGKHLGPIKDNIQLRFLTLCAMLVYKMDFAITSIIYIGKDGKHKEESCEYSTDTLSDFCDRLYEMQIRVDDLNARKISWVDVNKGKHCIYCDAKGECKKL